MGVGLAHKRKAGGLYENYIVARYYPPGNMQGQFAENVGRKRSQCELNMQC